jgi:hypothetical protein
VVFFGPLVVLTAAAVGGLVDSMENASIYQRAPRTPEVQVAPLAGPRSAGLSLSVRF